MVAWSWAAYMTRVIHDTGIKVGCLKIEMNYGEHSNK